MAGVINGNFETGDFHGWEISSPPLGPPIIATTAHSGAYSAMLTSGSFIQQTYRIPIKQVQNLQYWISTSDKPVWVTISFVPKFLKWWGRSSMSGEGILEANEGLWHKFVFKVPKGKLIRAIRFQCAGETMGIYIDDIKFNGPLFL